MPAPSWDEVAPSPPVFDAGAEPPAPGFTSSSSSSVCMGSVLGALAGDAPRGSMVDGGGVLGVALCGPSCCCSPLAYLARSAPKYHTLDARRRGVSGELTLGAAVRAAQHHQWCPRSTSRGLATHRDLGPLHSLGQRLHVPAKTKTSQDKRHRLRRQR